MAWNGSDRTAEKNTPFNTPRVKKNPRCPISILVMLALAIVCGVVGWFLLGDGLPLPVKHKEIKKSRVENKSLPRTIKKDQSKADKSVEIAKKNKKPDPTTLPVPTQTQTPSSNNIIVNDGSGLPPDRYAILPLNCDKQIAGLLYAVPGQVMIGSVNFDEDFEKQFLESLKKKLEAPKDATDAEREMVEAVNDAKEVLVRSMKEEGKTAGEILRETRKQLRELGHYKHLLRQELRRYESDEEKTDQDVADLFDAANVMLKENGIEPFKPNDLSREVVRQYKFDQQEDPKE